MDFDFIWKQILLFNLKLYFVDYLKRENYEKTYSLETYVVPPVSIISVGFNWTMKYYSNPRFHFQKIAHIAANITCR